MKIAYLGYDFFWGCLDSLINAGHEILALYTFPVDNLYDFNDHVFRLAEKTGARISTDAINGEDVKTLGRQGCDLILAAAYPFKIPDYAASIPYAVNIHPTLLPAGRGRWPLPWTILKGLDCSGITYHQISRQWDAGHILAQYEFPVSPHENLETLSMKAQLKAKSTVAGVVDNIEYLWSHARPQTAGDYWPMLGQNERVLDWTLPVDDILRVVRAFGKFDSNALVDGTLHWVQDADGWNEVHDLPLGTVIHRSNREIVIAARDGFICLRHWQIPKQNAQ